MILELLSGFPLKCLCFVGRNSRELHTGELRLLLLLLLLLLLNVLLPCWGPPHAHTTRATGQWTHGREWLLRMLRSTSVSIPWEVVLLLLLLLLAFTVLLVLLFARVDPA